MITHIKEVSEDGTVYHQVEMEFNITWFFIALNWICWLAFAAAVVYWGWHWFSEVVVPGPEYIEYFFRPIPKEPIA